MNTASTVRVVAGAFLVFGLSFAEWGYRHHHAAMQELAVLREKQVLLSAEIKRAEKKLEATKHVRGQPQAALDKSPPATGQKADVAQRNAMAVLLSSHPRLLELFLRSSRADLNRRYGVFYHLAGLSPEQIEKFEDLATKRQAETIDLAATAAAQNLENSDPAIETLRAQQDDQLRTDQIALLGDTAYQQLQQYNRAQKPLSLVNGAALLALGPTDVYTYTQAGQLMQIMANASPPYQQGGSFDPVSVDWNSVLAQASAFLSPPQLDALKVQAQAIRLTGQLVPSYRAQQSGK